MTRPRTFDRDAAARKAMELFWKQGYAATSYGDITAHLGLGRGSLYAAYGSKEGLFLAALDQYRERGLAFLHAALSEGRPVRESLHAFMSGRLEESVTDPLQRGCLLVNSITERLPHDAAAAEFARSMQAANTDAIAAALDGASARGELRADTDSAAIAAFLVTVLNGVMVSVKVRPDQAELSRTIDLALGVVDACQA
ncbi:TetR/AcrR family transcriptional regulator [Streptomyces sp. NPDC097610]|uniref:TetR/AcrR family transcriptional regulator n=1 Tax=Streptomyces sp. NPDC097610 TaxID=3157227 RepID=UPI0033262C8B